MREFYGYKRPDGKVGIRNYVLILPSSACATDVARMVSQQVPGTVTFNNQQGCSQLGKDLEYTMNVLVGFAANPNIYATLVIGLGCENCLAGLMEEKIKAKTNKPVFSMSIQEEGGSKKCIEHALVIARQFAEEASKVQKVKCSISDLMLGTECGGSDPTSGLAANPVIGALSDKIVRDGGTAILSETTEMIGAEHILAARAKNEHIKERIYEITRGVETHFKNVGKDVREGNPSPGNKAGGITTLEEKSLGCIYKGGTTTVQEVYGYGEVIPKEQKGLVIMDTPGNDPSSIAGMLAGGAQIVVFSTGRGTPMGSPIAPVIKLTGNKFTYANMKDNIDFDASGIISGDNSIDSLADELYDMLIETCDGKETKAEELGFTETAIARQCNFT